MQRRTFDIAACTYYAGIDPFTKKTAGVAKAMRDRNARRALVPFFKPENWLKVRKA
jgi:hypothetical protein